MNQNQTIDMSAREQALYNAGEQSGRAKAHEEIAAYIEKIAGDMRASPGAQTLAAWVIATATGVAKNRKGLTPKESKALAESLHQFAAKSPGELQEGLVQFVVRVAGEVKTRAATHRQLFAQHVGHVAQLDKQDQKAGIGTRIVKRIARNL